MSLSSATISVQKAGSAVFQADVELKSALKDYSEQVIVAMRQNPFNIGNDALFENWKSLARFSQTVSQIELELKKVHSFISALVADEPLSAKPVLALATPADLAPTDVVVKRKKPKAMPAPAPAGTASNPAELKGNAAKLMQHLETLLKPDEFAAISQTAIATLTGIPLGSMTASVKRLTEAGHIVAGPAGTFKLGRVG